MPDAADLLDLRPDPEDRRVAETIELRSVVPRRLAMPHHEDRRSGRPGGGDDRFPHLRLVGVLDEADLRRRLAPGGDRGVEDPRRVETVGVVVSDHDDPRRPRVPTGQERHRLAEEPGALDDLHVDRPALAEGLSSAVDREEDGS